MSNSPRKSLTQQLDDEQWFRILDLTNPTHPSLIDMNKVHSIAGKFPPRRKKNMTPIEKAFTYHAPKNDQPEKYIEIRERAKELAELFEWHCPESRERSLAMTNLEQAVMWANASIARNE